MRKEFERVAPEAVGIPSAAVEWLLDRLEGGGFTEPHGLMLMRHGKVFAEGWWAPYAPGIRHGLQSHTKTYAATAVGIAYTEGLLWLDERVIDIFPETAPAQPSENLRKLTVRDVLCMSCGMDTMPRPTKDWIRDFLAIPVNHVPGTTYMYNSMGSTLLGAMVRQKTGLGLHDYLKPRLFDKIGIDADNLRWMCLPDGMEVGGGGLYATTEDNLRLMKLYADGGVWEGERILAEDYVRLATSLQNESATEAKGNPVAYDNHVGYGFQIWMCRPRGVYRADGAMGQFTIVVPERDMILAITEYANGGTGSEMPQRVLDTFWAFLDRLPAPETEKLPADAAAADHLARRMRTLALPAPAFRPVSDWQSRVQDVCYRVSTPGLYFNGNGAARMMTGAPQPDDVTSLTLHFAPGRCELRYQQGTLAKTLIAATDGSRWAHHLDGLPSEALCSGAWTADDLFELRIRWIETCNETVWRFRFAEEGLTIETDRGLFESAPCRFTACPDWTPV